MSKKQAEPEFVMTPPPGLKIPEQPEGELRYFIKGVGCLWTHNWRVHDDNSPTGKVIRWDAWRFVKGMAPSVDQLPDEYLMAELKDLASRATGEKLDLNALEAGRLYMLYPEGDWRYQTVHFLERTRSEAERIYPLDPPEEVHWMVKP